MKKYKSVPIVLSILAPSIILRALAMDILLSCIPAIATYFQAPYSTTQWLLSIYFLGAGFGQLVVGPLADEYGRRKVLIFSTILIVITSYACTQITDINLMIFMRFLQGLGACGTTVVSMAIIRDIYADQELSKVYSYFNSIVALAPLLAPLLGGVLLMQTGTWQSTFYFITFFSLFAVIVDYFFVAESNPKFTGHTTFVKVPVFKSYVKLIKDKQFLSYCCFDVMGFSSMFLFFSISSILLINKLGMDPQQFGYYFTGTSLTYLIGNMLSPLVQRKFHMNGTIFLGSKMMLIGGIAMLASGYVNGLTALSIVVPNAISTFGVGLLFGPSMAGVVQHYKNIAGIASAAYGAIFLGAGSLIVGILMQIEVVDAKILAISLAAMGLINMIVLLIVIPRRALKSI